jgi:hypothetical protein
MSTVYLQATKFALVFFGNFLVKGGISVTVEFAN